MKPFLLILLMAFAIPVAAQDDAAGQSLTQTDCIDQLQLRRDTPEVLDLVDVVREMADQLEADGDTEPVPLSPEELEALLLYANSDLTLDDAMIVIGEDYDALVEVPQEIVHTLLDQGDALDETEGDISVPECNYVMHHGDITVACGGDTPFSVTQPTENPPQPVRLADRGSVLVMNLGQGIVINLTALDDGDVYVGQLERPDVTFRYVLQATDDAYQGTLQQLPLGEEICPDLMIISNFTLQAFDQQAAGTPDVQPDALFDINDIWGADGQ